MTQIFMNYKKLLLFTYFLLFYLFANAQIVINEYSCANLDDYADNFGKYEDWIELYNPTSSAIDIAGFHMTDRVSKPTKWEFPDNGNTVIPSHGFLIVFASNRDTAIGNFFHTSFALKQTMLPAEKIILTNQFGQIIDSTTITRTQLGHSCGRISDGVATWGKFSNPTPLQTNNTAQTVEYAPTPVFSLTSGFYTDAVDLEINTPFPSFVIRYTLDGSEPIVTSPLYSSPIHITSTTVVKAKLFSPTQATLPGFIEYATFFINVNHSLPVVSISATELTDLANGSGFLEPKGTTEYFGTDKLLKTRAEGEFNRHGQDSWVCDQRSLDFVARDEHGYNYALINQFFPLSERTEYQKVIFRASGDDNYPCGHNSANEGSAHMRDGYIQNLACRGDLHLDVRSCDRIVIYINGEYWGVYEIREKPDDHDFTKFYYDQDKYHLQYLQTWGGTWAQYGGDQAFEDWATLYNFIMTNDLTIPENYEYVCSKYNVKSLVDYFLVNSFTVCSDWLNYNVGWWRGTDPDGDHKKWGYILWDNDATFGFYINYTGIPDTSATALPCNPETLTNSYSDPEGHVLILNKLNTNPDFHQYYVNRQADLLNTAFSSDTMLAYLDYYAQLIEPEMEQHAQRWYGTYNEWYDNYQRLRYFIERRTESLEGGVADCYQLSGPYDLTLDVETDNIANIKINSVEIKNFPWTGRYYGDILTELKLVPIDTSLVKFENWSASFHDFSPNADSLYVTLSLTEMDTVVALFSNVTGINETPESSIKVQVFPSAVTDFVTVSYYLPEATKIDIELYSISGQPYGKLIPTTNYAAAGNYDVKIDFGRSSLAPGIYLLNFVTEKERKAFKIVYLGN